jgi:hypothetical protein
MVHELTGRLHGLLVIQIMAHDMQARGGFPEVTPAPGEHARPHAILRRKERQHVVEDVIREGAEAVTGSSRRRRARALTALSLRGHSVEQVVGVDPTRQPPMISLRMVLAGEATRKRKVKRKVESWLCGYLTLPGRRRLIRGSPQRRRRGRRARVGPCNQIDLEEQRARSVELEERHRSGGLKNQRKFRRPWHSSSAGREVGLGSRARFRRGTARRTDDSHSMYTDKWARGRVCWSHRFRLLRPSFSLFVTLTPVLDWLAPGTSAFICNSCVKDSQLHQLKDLLCL